jgi:lysozyme
MSFDATKAATWLLGLGSAVGAYYYFARKTQDESFTEWGSSILTRANLAANSITGTYLDRALALIANEEGFSSRAYPDPVGQAVTFSIGYGHQIRPGDGLSVDSVITEQQGLQLLSVDVSGADSCVAQNVKVQLTDNQRAALVSFCYNVGCGAFQSSSMLRFLNAGDYGAAANEFPRWKFANGSVLDALVNRRDVERSLFLA